MGRRRIASGNHPRSVGRPDHGGAESGPARPTQRWTSSPRSRSCRAPDRGPDRHPAESSPCSEWPVPDRTGQGPRRRRSSAPAITSDPARRRLPRLVPRTIVLAAVSTLLGAARAWYRAAAHRAFRGLTLLGVAVLHPVRDRRRSSRPVLGLHLQQPLGLLTGIATVLGLVDGRFAGLTTARLAMVVAVIASAWRSCRSSRYPPRLAQDVRRRPTEPRTWTVRRLGYHSGSSRCRDSDTLAVVIILAI